MTTTTNAKNLQYKSRFSLIVEHKLVLTKVRKDLKEPATT